MTNEVVSEEGTIVAFAKLLLIPMRELVHAGVSFDAHMIKCK